MELEDIALENLTAGPWIRTVSKVSLARFSLTVTQAAREEIMQKYLLRVLGPSLLAVVGLMAFASAGAQAGEVKVLGAQATVGQEITGKLEGTNNQLLVPGLKLEIRCPDIEALAKVIKSGAGAEVLAVILYLGCTAWGLNAPKTALIELTSCHILDGTESGKEKHITAKAIIAVDLIGFTTLLIAQPDAQAFFAKLKFTTGLGCTLTTPIEIKGEAAFEMVTGNLQNGGTPVAEPLIQSSETIQKLHAKVLKYGANEAFIDGSALLALVGGAGCTWGAL